MEEGYITFADGAWEIQKQLNVGWGDACRRLRVACREEWITTMLAPYDNGSQLPSEFWTGPVAPSDWRQRDIDCSGLDADGCVLVAMLNEDDFRRWRAAELTTPKTRPARGSGTKRPVIIKYLSEMFPKGVPDPAHYPRKRLRADLVEKDQKRLAPLDEATLKSAIEEYNRSIRNDPI
jgi:hypothetical protein